MSQTVDRSRPPFKKIAQDDSWRRTSAAEISGRLPSRTAILTAAPDAADDDGYSYSYYSEASGDEAPEAPEKQAANMATKESEAEPFRRDRAFTNWPRRDEKVDTQSAPQFAAALWRPEATGSRIICWRSTIGTHRSSTTWPSTSNSY